MPFAEAVRLALAQLRVQKLKSFFTLMGVTIGVMFLIAVVSVVNGMGRYVERDFAGKFLGVNTFNLRKMPDIGGDYTEDEWRRMQRRPPVTVDDANAVRAALEADPALLPLVLSGGDDYELLFAAPPERSGEVLARAAAAGTPVTPVGVFAEGPPEVAARGADGAPLPPVERGGWSHF